MPIYQPIDYSIKVNTDPFAAYVDVLKLKEWKSQQEQNRIAEQQKQLYEQQKKSDLAALGANPTTEGIAKLSSKYPELSKQFKETFDMLDPIEQKARQNAAMPVYSALSKGDTDTAISILRKQAEAAKNSGKEGDYKAITAIADSIAINPSAAQTSMGLLLSSIMKPGDFATTFSKSQEDARLAEEEKRKAQRFPIEQRKAEAETKSAEAKAAVAEQSELAELAKKNWDIKAIQNDIEYKKQSNRIASLNAAIAREGNDLKRAELAGRLQDAKAKRDETARNKVAEYEAGVQNIDNSLSTVDEAINTPISIMERALGPTASRLPTLDENVANFEGVIDTLKSQVFLSQVSKMKGLGSLTEIEGAKIESAVRSLDKKQSPEQFMKNLKIIKKTFADAKETLRKKFGAPAAETPDQSATSVVEGEF